MHSDTVTIYCPNYLCQAPNPEQHAFCQQCRTLLPKRFLWVVGKGSDLRRPGEWLADRYVVKQPRIVLDTQPGVLPETPDDIPAAIEPYLKLAPYQLHVPQVYGIISASPKRAVTDTLLLEGAPIVITEQHPESTDATGDRHLLPALTEQWPQAIAMQQLDWLWQIAHLWQPLSLEGVATTLLEPKLLRVEGSLVRLLELRVDSKTATLGDLGRLWQQWQPRAQPEIAEFVGQICQRLQQGQIRNAEQLVTLLDRALVANRQSQTRRIHLATLTDQGPSRQRNEDACFPPSGTVTTIGPEQPTAASGATQRQSRLQSLVVVCDGIGGHEGGNVASNLAIETVQHQLQSLYSPPVAGDASILMHQLEQAILVANDVISQRNDNEHRQERQRMGTTLIMALAAGHEVYLAHVGDSRIYRVTRLGCHQVTLDDDLASREVRLGYALYRDALQQPGAGALVQALGMGASTLLHPTVQRFVLDEDCVFLLCTDGLSDNDRVEEYWQSELLPVLEGKVDVATASQRLVTIANSRNGHDNVTIGLVYCQVTSDPKAMRTGPIAVPLDLPAAATAPPGGPVHPPVAPDAALKTRILAPPRRRTNPFLALLSIMLLLGLGAGLAYALVPAVRFWVSAQLGLAPNSSTGSIVPSPPTPSPTVSVPLNPPLTPEQLTVGSLIQVNRLSGDGPVHAAPIVLQRQPEPLNRPSLSSPAPANAPSAPLGIVPEGTVLQIASRQRTADQGLWLKLKVCSVPDVGGETPQAVKAGEMGWIEPTTIAPLVTQNLSLTTAQLGACTVTGPAPTPSTPLPSATPPKSSVPIVHPSHSP